MSFGGPFGYGGMMPPAQSGGLDHYDPNEYRFRPLYNKPPKTPIDIYEKQEDKKTLGTILSTIFVALGALIFVHHVQALKATESLRSRFSPHSRRGKREASHILQDRLDSAKGKRQVEKIDKYYRILKNKNSPIESRLEARDELYTLLYSHDSGLSIHQRDPILSYDPPKNWFNRAISGHWNKFTQPGEMITVQKAHKLLESRSVKRLENKEAAPHRKMAPFDSSSSTLIDDVNSSSASSTASTAAEKLLLPGMTKKIDLEARNAVLDDKVFLKNAGNDTIQGHFESQSELSKSDKKELKSMLEKRHKPFEKEFKPYDKQRKHVDSIAELAKDTNNADEALKQIHDKAAEQLKGLKKDKESHKAHVKFYENIQKSTLARNEESDVDRTLALETIKRQITQLHSQETVAHDKVKLNESMISKLKES